VCVCVCVYSLPSVSQRDPHVDPLADGQDFVLFVQVDMKLNEKQSKRLWTALMVCTCVLYASCRICLCVMCFDSLSVSVFNMVVLYLNSCMYSY